MYFNRIEISYFNAIFILNSTHHILIAYLLLTHYRLLNLFKTRDLYFLTNITITVFGTKIEYV
jgi:hypothetical protein